MHPTRAVRSGSCTARARAHSRTRFPRGPGLRRFRQAADPAGPAVVSGANIRRVPLPPLTQLADDERLFRNSVYEFADREIRPLAREMDDFLKGAQREVPRAFERSLQGRLGLVRIGWAVIRPQGLPVDLAPPVPAAPAR